MLLKYLATLSLFVGLAFAHGVITSPPPRIAGAATRAACGNGVYNALSSDPTGPIELATPRADAGYNATACNIFLCRGLQFKDNTNIQTFRPGQVIPFKINLRVQHPGWANVSIVDLAAKTTIGNPVFYWPKYTNGQKNETDFSITLPDVGAKCQVAGACAIQWWWWANTVAQTYESCVDFVTPVIEPPPV